MISKLHKYIRLVGVGLAGLLLAGCDKVSEPGPPNPHMPYVLNHPTPAMGAVDVYTDMLLQWEARDPDGDSLLFDLYFGTDNRPSLLVRGLREPSYQQRRTLREFLTYYWYVEVYDPDGNRSRSRTFYFTTGDPYQFPLAAGNRWEHSLTSYMENFEPPHLAEQFADTMLSSISGIVRGWFELSNGVFCSRLEEFWQTPFGDRREDRYMTSGREGLLLHGIESFSLGDSIPEYGGLALLEAAERFNRERSAAAPVIFDSPLLLFAYPPTIGSEWTFAEVTGIGEDAWVKIRITDSLKVTVPAGTFDCWELTYIIDMDGDGRHDGEMDLVEYYAREGFIKGIQRGNRIRLTDETNGQLGFADIVDVRELVAYDINE